MAKIILVITMMGTQRNMPTTPQMLPQRVRLMMMTRGLRLRDLPINFGSRMLPTRIWRNNFV